VKHCHRCAGTNPAAGQKADSVERCSRCGGRAFFYGSRMSRILWPPIPEGNGPDTYDGDSGTEIDGAWEQEVSKITEPRWRR